jgi:hypothetical protein
VTNERLILWGIVVGVLFLIALALIMWPRVAGNG